MAKRLIIKSTAFQKETTTLLSAMETDQNFASDFIKNPVQQLSKYISAIEVKSYTKTRISQVNEFMFRLLSNKAFITWLKKYQSTNLDRLKAEALEKETDLHDLIMKDMATAMLKYGGFPELEAMFRLSGGATEKGSVLIYDEVVIAVKAVVLLLVAITQIDVTPRTLNDKVEISKVINVAQLRKVSGAILKHAAEKYSQR